MKKDMTVVDRYMYNWRSIVFVFVYFFNYSWQGDIEDHNRNVSVKRSTLGKQTKRNLKKMEFVVFIWEILLWILYNYSTLLRAILYIYCMMTIYKNVVKPTLKVISLDKRKVKYFYTFVQNDLMQLGELNRIR